jgi:hypothetical protein
MNEAAARLARLRKTAFATGIFFAALCGVGIAFEPRELAVSWLFAFIFWIGLSLGCFNAAMMHYLTGGHWGNPTRRFLEAGFMTLPLMAALFVPVLFGLRELYPWARPEDVAADKILQQKAAYENLTGFLLRAICFFAIWIFIALRLRKWSLQQDVSNDLAPTIKMRTLSGPGIVIVPLTVTFALVDWVMSLEAAWFSTIFGVILLAGQLLTALALATLLLAWMRNAEPFVSHFAKCDTNPHFHDLGNLLLAFVMFWAYVAFSQFLIIYSGNQPHEIGWYLRRIAGTWKWLLGFVAAFHFFAPFCLLLFRSAKRNVRVLAIIAGMIFLAYILEIFWVVAPRFYPDGIRVHWTDFAAWLGIGGLWLAVFAGNLKRHPLLARNDPHLANATAQTADAR